MAERNGFPIKSTQQCLPAMECIQCQRTFSKEDRVASISGSIMGDEHTDSYFLCPVCRVFTLFSWWDNFTGDETMTRSGPLSQPEARKRVDLIRKCSRPWDKKCRCQAHCEYFGGALD